MNTRAKRPPPPSLREMGLAIRRSFWALSLPPLVLGGIDFGIFSATEAAAIGALLALIIAVVVYRQFAWGDFWDGAQEAARTTAMLFFIIIGAGLFGQMLTLLRIPDDLVRMVSDYGLGKLGFIVAMMVVIFILGLILESVSIILITTPVVLPVLAALGIDKVWYGVLLTINLELALISPPVGMNLIVIKNIAKVPLYEIDRAAIPYILLMFLGMAILILWPGIATWLPSTMQLGK
jgi:C4-dicarboxylate transporter DctM subunit